MAKNIGKILINLCTQNNSHGRKIKYQKLGK